MINVTGNEETRQVFLNGLLLEIGPSQRLHFHSVNFSWGSGESCGSAQLALAILLELTGDKEFAKKHSDEFLAEWVVKLPLRDFSGWSKIDKWIVDRGGKIKNGYKLTAEV